MTPSSHQPNPTKSWNNVVPSPQRKLHTDSDHFFNLQTFFRRPSQRNEKKTTLYPALAGWPADCCIYIKDTLIPRGYTMLIFAGRLASSKCGWYPGEEWSVVLSQNSGPSNVFLVFRLFNLFFLSGQLLSVCTFLEISAPWTVWTRIFPIWSPPVARDWLRRAFGEKVNAIWDWPCNKLLIYSLWRLAKFDFASLEPVCHILNRTSARYQAAAKEIFSLGILKWQLFVFFATRSSKSTHFQSFVIFFL